MLLRSVIKHVNDQNWTAVCLDFFIVVVGVFIGIQVANWNEQRQLRERELNYLERLAEDLASMQAEFAEIMERGAGRRVATLRAFRALEACDAALAEPDDFQFAFAFYQNQRTAVLVDRTYEEMVASGALAAMDDRELSYEIASLFGELRNYKSFVDSIRISLPVIDRVLWRNLDLSYDDEGVPILRDFDFEAACANRELRNAAWEIYDLIWDWEGGTQRAADQLNGFILVLDRHIASRIGKDAS